MTPDTTCPSEERIFSYLLDCSEGEQDSELEAHIKSCEACTKILKQLSQWDSEMNGFKAAIDQGDEPESLPTRLGKYKIVEQLGIGGMGIVLKGYDSGLDRYVAIKVIKENFSQVPDFKERFLNEAKNLARINTENIVQIFDFATEGRITYLVMEYVEGEPFYEWSRAHSHHFPTFLNVFRQILNGLKAAHQNRILHRDLTPNNILIRKDGTVKILDFGLAKALGDHVYQGEFIFSGTMTYVAPEVLSGEAPSISSDLYSVGLACYEGLTGHHPFRSDTTDETKLKILSAEIVPPTMYRPDLPKDFEAVLLKCLKKNKDERFSHIDQIEDALFDVEETRIEFLQGLDASDSTAEELSEVMELQTPNEIYGREDVLLKLQHSFSMVNSGSFWASIIFGPSGIGKSQLIHSFMSTLDAEQCYKVSGKFEQLSDPKPYSALIFAFEKIIQQLQFGEKEKLDQWKEQFKDSLSGNGRLITDVIPMLFDILEEQPVLAEVPPYEARQRFESAMIDFIRSFCNPEKSLVLFIDDIQWADSGSLSLISKLLRGENLANLMLIVSFRGEELNHYSWLREQKALNLEHTSAFNINELLPLDIEMLENYLKDAFSDQKRDLRPLAEIMHQKTGGNPLYFRQWLEQLRRLNLIYPDPQNQCWLWHLDKIRSLDPHRNLLQLMREKLDLVSDDIRSILSMAACIGAHFEISFLSELTRHPLEELHQKLLTASRLGLIEAFDLGVEKKQLQKPSQFPEYYRFFHDQVQNAAYESLNSRERGHAHRRIAHLRLRKVKAIELDSWLFDIVHHYNLVANDNLTSHDLFERVKLNFRAGRRARAMHAYEQANNFLETSVKDLPTNFWDDRYDMAFVIHMERMVCAFLNSDFVTANEQLSELEQKVNTLPHQVLIEEKKVGLYTLVDRNEDALEAGQKAMARLGISMPKYKISTHATIGLELLKAKWRMRSKGPADILALPEMLDWQSQRAMDILPHLIHPAAVCRPDWIPVLSLKMFNLTCRKGLSNGSGFSVVAYAMLLAILGNYEKSYAFGKTALKLEENIDNRQLKCMTTTMFSALVIHWKRPIQEQHHFAERGMRFGKLSGDVHYGGLCRCAHFFSLFFKGMPLSEIENELGKMAPFMNHVIGTPNYEMYALWLSFFLRLQGKTSLQCSFFPQQIDIETFEKRLVSKGNPQNLAQYELLQAIYYVFERDDLKAYEHITRCAKHHDTFISLILQAEFFFYHGLIVSRVLRSRSVGHTKKLFWTLAQSIKKLKVMSEHCPENFSSRYYLLLAEQLRHKEKQLESLKMYQQALTDARKYMTCHIAAISAKEAGEVAEQIGLEDLSKTMKNINSQSLEHWGYVQP